MGRVTRILSLGLLALLLALVLAAIQAWFLRPPSINLFFERVFLQDLLRDPERLTRARLLEPMQLRFHGDELTPLSPERKAEDLRLAQDRLAELEAYDREALPPAQALSFDALHWHLRTVAQGAAWIHHEYPLEPVYGAHVRTLELLLQHHPFQDRRDAKQYVARLEAMGDKFEGVLRLLQLRRAQGIGTPRSVLAQALRQLQDFVVQPPERNPLLEHLRARLVQDSRWSPEASEALLAKARAALEGRVYPVYRRLIAFHEELLAEAPGDRGVWSLPDGDEYYQWLIRRHTTTQFTPGALLILGEGEVARLERELDLRLRALGHNEGTVGRRLRDLGRDPRFIYAANEDGQAQVLADYQHLLDEINAGLAPYFRRRPSVPLRVVPVPAFRAAASPAAYYAPAPLDGTRPAQVHVNVSGSPAPYRWSVRTLAYHEGIPGHHLQLSLAQTLEDVPSFRRGLLPVTAAVEGWALYAERLAAEMGFGGDAYDELGRLQAEMYRAARLVADIGLHRERWSREEALDYLRAMTGAPEGELDGEVTRILAWPGHGVAYTVGLLRLLELRRLAQARLGPRFDIRDFHETVLGPGPLPLDLLERHVRDWIRQASVS